MNPRPFLRWIGGKGRNIAQFLKHLPSNFHELAYVEPFLGSGAVFFNKKPRAALLADINQDLILTYRAIRDDVDALVEKLREHDGKDSEAYYYIIRDEFNTFDHDAGDAVAQAARFLYLNARCFNGLFRVNKEGKFNVAYARELKGLKRICVPGLYRSVSRLLDQPCIKIEHGSFEKTIDASEQWADGKRCFLFLDPPYYPLNETARFTSYADEWKEEDFLSLKASIDKIHARGDLFLLCNSAVPFMKDLFSDFYQIEHVVSRHVSCKVSERRPVLELLVSNYKAKTTQGSLMDYLD